MSKKRKKEKKVMKDRETAQEKLEYEIFSDNVSNKKKKKKKKEKRKLNAVNVLMAELIVRGAARIVSKMTDKQIIYIHSKTSRRLRKEG